MREDKDINRMIGGQFSLFVNIKSKVRLTIKEEIERDRERESVVE